MADVYQYDINPNNNNSAPPDGWPENQPYNTVNNCAREMQAADARDYQDRNGTLTATGTNGAYVVTLNRSSVTALFDGLLIGFKPVNARLSGGSTLDVNGIGAQPIQLPNGENPVFVADAIYQVIWNSTRSVFQVVSSTEIEVAPFSLLAVPSDRDLVNSDLNGPILLVEQGIILTVRGSQLNVTAGDRIRIVNSATFDFSVQEEPGVNIATEGLTATIIGGSVRHTVPYQAATLLFPQTQATVDDAVLFPGLI